MTTIHSQNAVDPIAARSKIKRGFKVRNSKNKEINSPQNISPVEEIKYHRKLPKQRTNMVLLDNEIDLAVIVNNLPIAELCFAADDQVEWKLEREFNACLTEIQNDAYKELKL